MLTSVSTFGHLIPIKVNRATHADFNTIAFQYEAQHLGASFPPRYYSWVYEFLDKLYLRSDWC